MSIEIIDLTSPKKQNPSPPEVERAIAAIPEAQIRSVLVTICRSIAQKSPEHAKDILDMLVASHQTPATAASINNNNKRPASVEEDSPEGRSKVTKVSTSDRPARVSRTRLRQFHARPPLKTGVGTTPSTPTQPKKKQGVPSPEICKNCGEELSYEDDGCCKVTMMGYLKRERYQEILNNSDSDDGGECEYGCGECGFDEEWRPDDDTWCKPRRMANARRDKAKYW
ncbi:hypothetical protein E2P81_ATG07629 [Venturia nashicola]|uniref:Uncharacterized protein n=1 Tax=Venturia nashicola TaxID=86259 RepID=A0A4Z1PFT3_9PEZI|nr:hypothetical protein E6O75_ATG07788 [Venturia nashicola]TLD32139.1 hypothetical protein E2P81_ATG07629 [Venturia nashicola]